MSNHKHILLSTSVFKKNLRQDLSMQSILKLSAKNLNVNCCLVQQESDLVLYDNINIIRKLTRNSSDSIVTSTNIPFINDIFDILAEEAEDIFVYSNSDIILTQQLIEYINQIHVEAFGISRIDISSINNLNQPAQILRMEPSGFDCWVISKKWWVDHRELFEDFLIGRPYFDVMYTMIMFLHSNNSYVSNQHLIYHVAHNREWVDKDECYHFNRLQKEKHYEHIEKVWGECCNNTFLTRFDWGSFLKFGSDETQIINEIKRKFNNKAK